MASAQRKAFKPATEGQEEEEPEEEQEIQAEETKEEPVVE